ncbi:thiamine phosphate synthase [Sphingomonas daechungensis]|uniref:thiamine phosphate synthase n=1 Tax=Sphingomonas daechungensis TaxID=1176646 RepID=UPI001CB923A5|nr:thiamine phosphate synthase [Sphingomonas daechungensis]
MGRHRPAADQACRYRLPTLFGLTRGEEGAGGRIADICHRRSLALAIAADVDLARTLGADLVHNPSGPTIDLPFSRSVHSVEEAEDAKADGATLVFVSPVYPTRSHPGGKALHRPQALRIAKAAGVPAIALGGMDELKSARLEREGFYGWAGIDAWLGGRDA